MTRHLILGTAGHIDHGKTALVRALTGVDCDRLPEEKARGITLDLGFAPLDLGDARLGVIDVPGHERLVRTMLAGATGIDLALLVVAADDGVMPQTREHADVLRLLGVPRGVVAVTKADLAPPERCDAVAAEARTLLAGSPLADAPAVAVSAVTGAGIDELRAALLAACAGGGRPDAGWFRLAVDRAFAVAGAGTVVTGTVVSGGVRVGDELEWFDLDGAARRVRVRGLHSHDEPAAELGRGRRAALNLAGVRHTEIARGHELATPGVLTPSRLVTARVHALATPGRHCRRPLRHRLPVRLHLGTGEAGAQLALPDRDALAPGESALAQLFLDRPVVAARGQPFVLREASAGDTLGGGRVLLPAASKLRRGDEVSLRRLAELEAGDVAAAAWFRGTAAVRPADLVRDAGLTPADADAAVARLTADGTLVAAVHADRVAEVERRAVAALDRMHAEEPLTPAHERSRVAARLTGADAGLVAAALDRLVARGDVTAAGDRIARAGFGPALPPAMSRLKDEVVAAYREAGFAPPEPKPEWADVLAVCVAAGELVKVGDGLYLHADAEAELRRRVGGRLSAGGLTVAEVRDLLGTTRKFAVPLCEYLDRVGVTRRSGDRRVAPPPRPG